MLFSQKITQKICISWYNSRLYLSRIGSRNIHIFVNSCLHQFLIKHSVTGLPKVEALNMGLDRPSRNRLRVALDRSWYKTLVVYVDFVTGLENKASRALISIFWIYRILLSGIMNFIQSKKMHIAEQKINFSFILLLTVILRKNLWWWCLKDNFINVK